MRHAGFCNSNLVLGFLIPPSRHGDIKYFVSILTLMGYSLVNRLSVGGCYQEWDFTTGFHPFSLRIIMESLRGLFVLVQEHFLLRLLSRYAQVNSFSFRQIILTKSSQKYTVGKIFTFGSSKNWETLTKSFLVKCFSIELVLKDKDPVFRSTSYWPVVSLI